MLLKCHLSRIAPLRPTGHPNCATGERELIDHSLKKTQKTKNIDMYYVLLSREEERSAVLKFSWTKDIVYLLENIAEEFPTLWES